MAGFCRPPDCVPSPLTSLLLTPLVTIPAWIAWGGCRQGSSAPLAGFGGFMHFGIESGVRIAIAVAAVIMTLIAVAAWWTFLPGFRGPHVSACW